MDRMCQSPFLIPPCCPPPPPPPKAHPLLDIGAATPKLASLSLHAISLWQALWHWHYYNSLDGWPANTRPPFIYGCVTTITFWSCLWDTLSINPSTPRIKLVQCRWSDGPLVRKPIGLTTHWSEKVSLVRNSLVRKTVLLVQRLIGPKKQYWSENPLVRRPSGQKTHWSEKSVIGPKMAEQVQTSVFCWTTKFLFANDLYVSE